MTRRHRFYRPLAVALALTLTACGGAGASSPAPQDPESVFERFNDAIIAGDGEAAAAHLADGVTLFGRTYEAGESLMAVRSLPCTTEILSSSVEGDQLAADVELSGPNPIADEGLACDVGARGTLLVTVEDGRITSIEPVQE